MGIYLKKFETQSAYEAAQSGLILPNVSLTVDNNTVHYNPSTPVPPTPTYESVDLGLPSGTLWAKYNVGATSETEYGNYYEWGAGNHTYQETGGHSELPSYDNNGNLVESADTAIQAWGGDWHMPTKAQCEELEYNTTYSWETNFKGSGINGGKFMAQNGNYVFFPAAGRISDGIGPSVGEDSYNWSSFVDDNEGYFWYLGTNSYYGSAGSDWNYNNGCSVRPVIG